MPSSSTILSVSQQVQNVIIEKNKAKNIIYLQLRMENFDQLYTFSEQFTSIWKRIYEAHLPWVVISFVFYLYENSDQSQAIYINIKPN